MPSIPRCVYCRRRGVEAQFRPFCSERCKMADLGRWLGGGYAVADRSAPETDHDPVEAPDDIADEAEWLR